MFIISRACIFIPDLCRMPLRLLYHFIEFLTQSLDNSLLKT